MSQIKPALKKLGKALLILLPLGALLWLIGHADPTLTQFEDWFLRQLEQKGTGYIATWGVLCVLFIIALYVYVIFLFAQVKTRSRTIPNYWLRILLRSLLVLIPVVLAGLALDRLFGKNDFVRHPLFYGVWVRTLFVLLLLTFGIALYFFKLKWKTYYGLSEIGLALLSNLAIIRSLDVSAFPRLSLGLDKLVAIGAFTYILSRGITNVAEGIQDRLAKQPEPPASTAPTATPHDA